MKTILNAKSIVLLVMIFAFGATLNAQRHYKHPRVKVKAEKVTKMTVKEEKTSPKVIAPVTSTVVNQEEVAINNETTTNDVTVASTNKADVKVTKIHKNIKRNEVVVKEKKNILDLTSFTKKLMKHDKILKVQDVKNTNMETWLLIVIILGAAAVLFLILAIIGGVTYIWALWIIGWIFFALCIIGIAIVLPLGLTGVI